MRTFERRFNETEMEFVERVNTTLMDDFATELMKQGKSGDETVTINYIVLKNDLEYFDTDDLFWWEVDESQYLHDAEDYICIEVTTSCDCWEIWDKARAHVNEWIIDDDKKGIFNVATDEFISAGENWPLHEEYNDKQFIRYIVASNDLIK